jgi:hypothetical protein
MIASALHTASKTDLALWHGRTMHHHIAGLQRAICDQSVTDVTLDTSDKPDAICQPCLAGKMHATPFRSTGTTTAGLLDLVHADLVQMPVCLISGFQYFVAFHDDASSFHAA